ncbi:transglycosylase SLT domain-containing protein [uncultured Roseobacter sp.]|uniref:transglycosylase SLT domain-containing protein n=1 Tax=uncultured Roseobacter sp. TaxID=114847 RepID=UPI0026042472|nr:transglycosylase SLT domain-containing protein [uncultured Roseobacter sp.]
MTRTETGRTLHNEFLPWPWTVNSAGTGVWFQNEFEALQYIRNEIQRGERSLDIGCFQINFHWHGDHFDTLEEMINPEKNAQYAARFLKTLYQESGDWTTAVGKFHSRTARHSENYLSRYSEIFASLDYQANDPASATIRVNSFPFLQRTSERPAMGSLVPRTAGTGTSLFDRSVSGN